MYISFNIRVRQLLDAQEKTWYDLAEGSGVCRTTLWRGVKKRSTLAALAYFFGITVEELVSGTDAENIWFGEDL